MLKPIAFCLILIAASSFMIREDFEQKSAIQPIIIEGNLQFSNYTGSSISPAMVTYITKTINEAYTYYAYNYSANLQYIQSRLEGTYNQYFSVVIINQNLTYGGAYLYSTDGTTFLTWSGVNNYQKNWVYIISANPNYIPTVYIPHLSRGSGITDSKHTIIQNVLKTAEGPGPCICASLRAIHDNLKNFDGNKWNIICKPYNGNLAEYSRIRVTFDQWDFTSPNTCEYLVWTTNTA